LGKKLAGIDEAGRGPVIGPMVIAAVTEVMPVNQPISRLVGNTNPWP